MADPNMSQPEQPQPTESHVAVAVELDRICDEFEQMWRKQAALGKRPRIEAFVATVRPSQRKELLCELLEMELELRQEKGDFVWPEEYYRRFPELRDRIESMFNRVVKRVRLGDYELRGELGHGGMGVVYRARQINLNQTVALKVLSQRYLDEPQAIARFKREMQSIGGLEHPNIVRAYNAGEANGAHFLAMEYVDGIDLQRLVRPEAATNRALNVGAACEVIRQAAMGLQHAHKHGIVHRDVKPANLMLSRAGVVKLLDLGLAKLQVERNSPEQQSDGLTQTGITMGTIDYMAPEQWDDSGAVDIRADIYSLGCTLFFLMAARTPYGNVGNESNRKKIMAHVAAPIPSLTEACPDCPLELEKVFERMLAKSPEDRFQTPAEVAKAIAPFAAPRELVRLATSIDGSDQSTAESEPAIKSSEIDTGETALPLSRPPKQISSSQRTPRRRRLLLSLLAFIAAAAVMLLVVDIVKRNRAIPNPPADPTVQDRTIPVPPADPIIAQHKNDLLLLPGLNGNWWFDEMPWYTPFMRQAVADAIAQSNDRTSLLDAKSDFYLDANTIAVQRSLWEIVQKCRNSLSQPQNHLLDTLKGISDSDHSDAELSESLEQAIEQFKKDHKGPRWEAVDRHTLACLQHKLCSIRVNGATDRGSNRRQADEAKMYYDEAFGEYAAEDPLRRLCRADSALLCSQQLDDYHRRGESQADDGTNRFGEAIKGDNVSPLFKAATLIAQGGEASAHAHAAGQEYELNRFEEANDILQRIVGKESCFENHPLFASALTSRAWGLMDQWKVDEAQQVFDAAELILKTNRKRNKAVDIEYFHTRHGVAIASRYQGDLGNVRSVFISLVGDKAIGRGERKGEIETARDSVTKDLVGRQRYIRDLTERWANSAERLADCQLYGGAASGNDTIVSSAQAGRLYNRARDLAPDPGSHVVMTCKYCIISALSGGLADAKTAFAEVASVNDKDIGGDRERAMLARQLASAVLALKDEKRRGDGLQALRLFLDQFDQSTFYDANRRETLEMRLLAAELLLSAGIRETNVEANQDDLKHLESLLDIFKHQSHDKIKPFLHRYYELAIRSVGKEAPAKMAKYLLKERASNVDPPSSLTSHVVFHFAADKEDDPKENYVIVVPADGKASLLLLKDITRSKVQKECNRGGKLKLPDELLQVIAEDQTKGHKTVISWEDADCFFFLNLTKGLTKEHWKPFADQLDYDTLLPPKRNPPATSVSGGDH
jgi:serine/threonine protein kinase